MLLRWLWVLVRRSHQKRSRAKLCGAMPTSDDQPLTIPELAEEIARLRQSQTFTIGNKTYVGSYVADRAARAFLAKYPEVHRPAKSEKAQELEAKGWEPWLKTLSPNTFKHKFVKEIGDFWDWYWPVLQAQAAGKRLITITSELAYTLFLARGMTKSTSAEWAVIAAGAVVGPAVVPYVSSTTGSATRHLQSIIAHVEKAAIAEYYPGLAKPRVGKIVGNRFGWSREMLAAECGLTAFAIGLAGDIRGLRVEDLRPTLIVGDDFDDISDSPDVIKKKEAMLGGSIFGTQGEDTIIIIAQNLIHRFSIARRIHLGRSQLLTDRRSSGVVKAFTDDFKVEQQPNGKYAITGGTPTWEGFNQLAAQKFVGTMGPILAKAEFQHEFDAEDGEYVMKNYVDAIHVITEEELCQGFGFQHHPSWRMPFDWWKYFFHDKARTKTEFHANIAGTLTVSSENTRLPGVTFLYDCLSFEEATEPDDCAIAFLRCISPLARVDGVDRDWSELRNSLISRANLDVLIRSQKDRMKAERAALAKVFPQNVKPLLTAYNYKMFRMSHEADDWAAIYQDTFGLPFDRPAITENSGQALINLAMKIDYNIVDPFGRVGYWSDDKEHFIRDPERKNPKSAPLMGMSRWYLVVKNDKLPYPNDDRPEKLHGSDLARYQFTEQRNLAPKENALGEEERGPEKRNDDFRQGCLVAGTLITTARGLVPIEHITVNDQVLTRSGFRPVLAAGQTGICPTVILETTDGHRLEGTGDHPILLENKGWTPLGDAEYNDACLTTKSNGLPSALSFKASPFTAIPPQGSAVTASTSRLTLRGDSKASAITTSSYGKRLTDPCQKVMRFITEMATLLTTHSTTCFVSPSPITWESMDALAPTPQKDRSGWWNSLVVRTLLGQLSADSASRITPLIPRGEGFVQSDALNYSERAKSWLSMFARIAERHSSRFGIRRTFARASVVSLTGSGIAKPVFNLQVDEVPEYFANGILVHNCQMFYQDHSLRARPLTEDEKVDLNLPAPIQNAAIEAETDPQKREQKHYAHEAALRKREAEAIAKRLQSGGASRNGLHAYKKLMKRGG